MGSPSPTTSNSPRRPAQPTFIPPQDDDPVSWSRYRQQWEEYVAQWKQYWKDSGQIDLDIEDRDGVEELEHAFDAYREPWAGHWRRVKPAQEWRTEPEISDQRQIELSELRSTATPDPFVGPFSGVLLDRAEVEWLLATHVSQGGTGPVVWDDKQHTRKGKREKKRKTDEKKDEQEEIGCEGLDLRGANLQGEDLSGLSLTGLRAGLVVTEWQYPSYSTQDFDPAAINLRDADLRWTHLEGACLAGAHLEGANLEEAYLQKATLYNAHCEGAALLETRLEVVS